MIWEFITERYFEIIVITFLLLFVFRKKLFKKKIKKKVSFDYSDIMDNGTSFESEFNMNKVSAEKKLHEIDEELKKLGEEETKAEEEFRKKKFMMIHKRKQLSIQYNMYLNNLKNVERLLENQKQLDEGVDGGL